MLYQPSYPKPYLTDIDATKQNNFECLVNAEGGTSVKKYNLTISDLNGASVYNSGIITVSAPVYSDNVLTMPVPSNSGMQNGMDYTWRVALYEDNPNIWVVYGTIQSSPASTKTDIYIRKSYLIKTGMYLKIRNETQKITAYDASTGKATVSPGFSTLTPSSGMTYNVYSDNVVSSDIFFQARTTPVLTINTVPSTVNSKSYTFTGAYTQAEGVNWKYYQWNIYNADGGVINTSNRIDTGEIKYYYDGFFNGERYGVSLSIETQDSMSIETDIIYFNVSYAEPDITNSPSATVNCNNNAVELTWSPPLINQGISDTGTSSVYEFVPNFPFPGGSSVKIQSEHNLHWYIGSENNPVYVPYESTTYINWSAPTGNFSGVVYEQIGEPIELLTISSISPAQCKTGDKYYNTKDKLIYTAIDTNQWGNNGITPIDTNMYYSKDTQKRYLWNPTTEMLSETEEEVPRYTVSYSKGAFTYEIKNIGIDITGSIVISEIGDKWLLQPTGADLKQSYIWDDTARWNDRLYWTETKGSGLSTNVFKLILLPTELQVVANRIPSAS